MLKYRLIHAETADPLGELSKMWGKPEFEQKATQTIPLSIADGKAAIAYVRSHSAEYGISKGRVGIIGFSAGGCVAAASAFNYDANTRPDFVAPIYAYFPNFLGGTVPNDAPPMFITVAANDGLQLTSHSIDLFNKWFAAKKEVELHVYEKGDHGFGMRTQHLPSDRWIDRFSDWLDMHGFFKPYDAALEQFERKSFKSSTGNDLAYRILYPLNYDAKKKYPVLLFLHGSGERGSDNEKQLVHGGKLFVDDATRKNFPAIVVLPQCPESASWNSATADRTKTPIDFKLDYSQPEQWPLKAATELVQSLVNSGAADKDRLYVSGLSMGGFGTFEAVFRHPEMFAAAAPICGGGDVAAYDGRVKKTSFWVFHGGADQVVPVKLSQEMVAKLKQLKVPVKYTEYPGVNHNSWDNVFVEPDYLKWMFGKKR